MIICENYHQFIWDIAIAYTPSFIVFLIVCLIFDYLRSMLFNNR